MEPEILARQTDEAAGRASLTATGPPPFERNAVDGRSPVAPPPPASARTSPALPSRVPASQNGNVAANGHGVAGGPAAYTNGNGVAPGIPPRMAVTAGGSRAAAAPAHVHAEDPVAASFYVRRGKRLVDVIGAAIALVLASPVLLLIAIAIKLDSRGPILYRSTRIGRGGRPFTFLKLRSMVHDADRHRRHLKHLNEADGPVFKICNDPRVTRVGRFLRITSLDEIPQFVNVLRGEMSLVGPRPPIPEEVAQYEPWQMRRLDVRPGITCLWQISGRSRIGFQEWMRLDLEYIRNQSFGLDAKILLRTIPAVLSQEGAY